MKCPCCEAPINEGEENCQYCGTKITIKDNSGINNLNSKFNEINQSNMNNDYFNSNSSDTNYIVSQNTNNMNSYNQNPNFSNLNNTQKSNYNNYNNFNNTQNHDYNNLNNTQNINKVKSIKQDKKRIPVLACILSVILFISILIVPFSESGYIVIEIENGYGNKENENIVHEDYDYNDLDEEKNEEKTEEKNEDNEENTEREESPKNENISSRPKNNKTKTSIIADKVYVKYIASKDAGEKLMLQDSNSQKKDNSKKITLVENSILKQTGIDTINLKELDIDFAEKINTALKWVEKNYPNELDELNQLSLTNAEIDYIAAFTGTNILAWNVGENVPMLVRKTILLNTKYFLNLDYYEKMVKMSVSAKHFPDNANTVSAVVHEVGHYLSYIAMLRHYKLDESFYITNSNLTKLYTILMDWQDGDFSHKIIKEAHQNYCKTNKSKISELEFRKSISGYAVAVDESGKYIYDETIAEAFHDYYLNDSKAADASQEIVKVLNKYLKK